MAAASSSSSSPVWNYDVFLSFRGEDTRKNIVSHLHKELVNKGIVIFKDDTRLEVGDSISVELIRAIQESRFAVVVLSKNYASSKWCLDELVTIMELHNMEKIKVIPIFYGVDPSHVRHQTESFALDKYQSPEMAEKVTNWRVSLTKIASVVGKDSSVCENEALMIEEVVEGISNQLLVMQPVDFSHIVGMDEHMERLNPLLSMESENEVRMVGIWGMGGIGKTTIARCLYDRFSRPFPGRCFLENFPKVFKKHGVSHLRRKILSTALSGVELGPWEIKARFGHRKVFVVLDNVNDMKQIHALTEESVWFGPGSRIIITTRDKGLLDSCGVKTIYDVKCLDTVDALQLFSQLAFEGGFPPSELYEELSIRATWLAHGLPAAIEAYGLFFRRMTSPTEWEYALCRLMTAPDTSVMKMLRISYDGLMEADKNVFLHVACLFNGEPLNRATTLLDDVWGVKTLADKSLIEITDGGYIKMHSLVDQTAREIVRQESVHKPHGRRFLWDPNEICKVLKSKVMIEPRECMELHMCELESALHLGEYRNHYETLRFLKVYKHSEHTKTKLYVSNNDTNLLSSRLRLLHWDTLPLSSFPYRFSPQDIVDVSLRSSNLTTFWKETTAVNALPIDQCLLQNLRRLDLSGSENLERLPDLSMAVDLEELVTQGCKRLKKIPESVSNLTRLTKLDVSYCDDLNSYNIAIRESTRGGGCGIALYFSGKEVEMEPIVVEMVSITNLSIGGDIHIQMSGLDGNADHLCFGTEQQKLDESTETKQHELPHNKPILHGLDFASSSEHDANAMSQFHDHEWMTRWDQQVVRHNKPTFEFPMRTVQAVPEFYDQQPSEFHGFDSIHIIRFNYDRDGANFLCNSLYMFPCLKELILINLNIRVIPDDVCSLQHLEKVDWSGNDFEALPEAMNQLLRLKYVSLCNCNMLKALPELVQLEAVKLSGCVNLQSLFEISDSEQDWGRFQLRELWIDECKNIESISDQLGHFINLSYVDLSRNGFEALPSSIGELSSLSTLCLNKCKKLKSIEGYPLCLKYLYAHGCESLENVSLPCNHSINHLDLSHCFRLKQVEHLVTRFLKEGLNEEDSPRFACFPGTKVPKYFGYTKRTSFIMTDLPQIWPSPKLLGFDGCFVVSCKKPFHIQLSPLSYDWYWGYERSFSIYLQPDFFRRQHSTGDEDVKSDHLIIVRGMKDISEQIDTFSIQLYMKSSKLKSPLAEIKACGVNLIWEDDQTDKSRTNVKVKKTSLFSFAKLKKPSKIL